MNKIIIAVIFMCSICFNGCAMQHVSYEIDYGKSEKYSKEDMDEAITQIMEEFDSWEGCTMHTVTYAGDDSSGSELTYCNEVGQNPPYDECIVFKSSFHSPREGGGAWNPYFEYEDWQWILARTSDSGWELLQWGY